MTVLAILTAALVTRRLLGFGDPHWNRQVRTTIRGRLYA